jgi:hypothetical protein
MFRDSVRIRRSQTLHPETLEGRNLLSAAGLKAIPAEVQSTSQLVPLSGSLEGTAVVTGNPYTGPTLVKINGQGNLSHLGKSTIVASHVSSVRLVNGVPVEKVTDGMATITAANGDQLYLTYSGTGMFNGTTGFIDTFNFQIKGGTGGFTNATGEGTILCTDAPNATFPVLPFTGTVEGMISTVGSNKKG